MSFIDHKAGEINFKIAYYGPGASGKSTNLRYVHDRTRPEQKTKLYSLPDIGMFFSLLARSFLPIDLA